MHRFFRARLRPMGAVALAGLTILSVVGVLSGSSQALTGSSFEETDGNLVANGGTDWATVGINCVSVPKVGCSIDKPSGSTDDAFGNGTKEDDPVPSIVSGSIPNNKSDLIRFYAAVSKENSKDFLHLAWERVQEPSGTTNMDFEFNQSSTLSANGVTPVRTAGDLLIKFDLSQGGNTPNLGRHVWITTGAGTQCEASNSVPCWGKLVAFNATQANGSVNAASVPDPIGPNAPRTLSARTFGEASINLTDTVFFGTTSCANFGSAYLKSRSSDSFTAAVKDFISPVGITVTNCGTINIHKQDDNATPLQGAGFTLYNDATPLDGAAPHGANDVAVVPAKTCTTDASGNCSLTNVPFGQYWVVETTTPTGHSTAPDQNVVVSPATSPLNLTFIDPRQPASIKIHKQDDAGAALAGAAFTMYVDNAPKGGSLGVEDTASQYTCTSAANGDCTFSGILVPGDYWIVETTVPAGYTKAPDRTVTVALGQNLDLSAPFVDARQPATVKLKKVDDTQAPLGGAVFTLFADVAPVGAPHGAGDTATGFTCTSASDGSCTISGVLPPGNYVVVETTTPAGYTTTADIAINLSLGQVLDLTGAPLVNPRKPGTIKLHKHDDAGADLAGAVFTLYTNNAPLTPPLGANDVITGMTCTSAANGDCTISGILPPGNYMIVETTVPAGYTAAADRAVTVGLDQVVDITNQPFVDARQPATVVLTKQDDAGAPLAGAVFTLYTNNLPTGAPRGGEDTITSFTCTSNAQGLCTISNILPAGNYWLVETTTPPGYSSAADQAITLSLGQTLTLAQPVVNPRQAASVTLHKQDDAGAPLAGAVFTLYANAAPTGAPRGAEDTITSFSCTTNASGNCTISNVLPAGNYWVVETTVPTGYVGAADRAITLALGQNLDISAAPFVNARKFTVIVLVCKESNNTLHSSTVTVDGVNKGSLASSSIPDSICATAGARYTGLLAGNHPANVNIP